MNTQNSMNKVAHPRRQGGWGLLEWMIVVALAGLALVMMMKRFGGQEEATKAQNFASNVVEVINEVNAWSATQSDTSAASNATLLSIVPDRMRVSGSVRNDFGGNVTMAPGTLNNGNDATVLTFDAIPRLACRKETSKVQNRAAVITVNGTVVKQATDTQINDAALSNACTDNPNQIAFTIAKT